MEMHNYLVSVFENGKNVNSYFSDNLNDLITIKALHKNCEISIFDLQDYSTMPLSQVEVEIQKSGERWKKSLCKSESEPPPAEKSLYAKKPEPQKNGKNWERRVMCVETGQVFSSIRDCCEKTGIPYMTIVNCIKNKNATRGVHFVNAPLQ